MSRDDHLPALSGTHHMDVTVVQGGAQDQLEPLSSATAEFIDLGTARVAVLSENRIVSVSPLILIPGAKAGFRAVFDFESRNFDKAVTFDGLCFLDEGNRPHGRTPLDGHSVDVHLDVHQVVIDIQIRVNLGSAGEVDVDAFTVNGTGEAASGRIGKRRLALPSGESKQKKLAPFGEAMQRFDRFYDRDLRIGDGDDR